MRSFGFPPLRSQATNKSEDEVVKPGTSLLTDFDLVVRNGEFHACPRMCDSVSDLLGGQKLAPQWGVDPEVKSNSKVFRQNLEGKSYVVREFQVLCLLADFTIALEVI
jgi:hypothetical protein